MKSPTGTNKKFMRMYFISSLFPGFLNIFIFWMTSKIFINYKEIIRFDITFSDIQFQTYLVTIILLILLLFSGLSTHKLIKKLNKTPDSGNVHKVKISYERNTNTLNTYLSVIVSTISLYAIVDNPMPTLIALISIYLILYKLVLSSTDYYPNISLVMLGWTGIVTIPDGENFVPSWIFIKNNSINM